MRKTFVWALVAMMAVAGSAFAQTLPGAAPATLDNDSTCDISTAPAATLLLPYFDVDLEADAGAGDTTLFTVTNVSALPQVAHVTVWTDLSAPVLDFNIFLTGYDVQAINLYDILVRGRIAEPGTTSDSDEGARSADNDANALLNIDDCDRLAVRVPGDLLADIQEALTDGQVGSCTLGTNQGDGHARGYITIDVASQCGVALPTDAGYAETQILFDNVLVGDYQQVDPANNFAQGGPLVHIRAIPEGGAPDESNVLPEFTTNLPRTFYSRYQDGGTADRRQPLPATFAARWIQGGGTGFETSYKIWREGVTDGSVTCDMDANAAMGVTEIVRFDEAENPETFTPDDIISPAPEGDVALPETSNNSVDDEDFFPPNEDGAVGGWMYLNLNNGDIAGTSPAGTASQNWVIVSMEAEGRYSVDFDAAWLGNGCSPADAATSEEFDADEEDNIGPLPNENDPII